MLEIELQGYWENKLCVLATYRLNQWRQNRYDDDQRYLTVFIFCKTYVR